MFAADGNVRTIRDNAESMWGLHRAIPSRACPAIVVASAARTQNRQLSWASPVLQCGVRGRMQKPDYLRGSRRKAMASQDRTRSRHPSGAVDIAKLTLHARRRRLQLVADRRDAPAAGPRSAATRSTSTRIYHRATGTLPRTALVVETASEPLHHYSRSLAIRSDGNHHLRDQCSRHATGGQERLQDLRQRRAAARQSPPGADRTDVAGAGL